MKKTVDDKRKKGFEIAVTDEMLSFSNTLQPSKAAMIMDAVKLDHYKSLPLKTPESSLKPEFLRFKVSNSEKQLISTQANLRGLSVSEYIRQIVDYLKDGSSNE